MGRYTVHTINRDLRVSTEIPDVDNFDGAVALARKGAVEIAAQEIVDGEPAAAVVFEVSDRQSLVVRQVVTMAVAVLATD